MTMFLKAKATIPISLANKDVLDQSIQQVSETRLQVESHTTPVHHSHNQSVCAVHHGQLLFAKAERFNDNEHSKTSA